MEQQLRENLATCLAAFVSVRPLSSARVAALAAGDWRFFDRVAAGTNFTIRKYDEVLAWFSANWPDGAVWPAEVPRPDNSTVVGSPVPHHETVDGSVA